MAEPFVMVPDYGWRRPSHEVPKQGGDVVITDKSSEYYGWVGTLREDEPKRQTISVTVESCVVVGFYRRDVRCRTTSDVLRVMGMEAGRG